MSPFEFFWLFARLSALTFGGGYAMVSLFQLEIVSRHGFLTADEFANLVAIAQVTPGPIGFNSATFIGLEHAGLSGSLLASLGVLVPSLSVTLLVAMFLAKVASSPWPQRIMKWLRPCVVGIIASAVVFFAKTAACWQGAAIFAIVLFVRLKWKKLNPVWSLAISALLGWVLFMV